MQTEPKPETKYRNSLPQNSGGMFLTDGGMETTLIFHHGVELPCFASFTLLRTPEGVARMRAYYRRYAAMALKAGTGFVLESPTWRANADWAAKLGYSKDALAQANRDAIALMQEIRDAMETPASPFVISGNIGPRGDGYDPRRMMSADEAQTYHAEQVAVFRDTAADFVSAFTMNYINEAVGISRAAQAAGMPAVLSFTVETDGRLPTGETLRDAVEQVDAATGGYPLYYMVNCAHPTHFSGALAAGEDWVSRIGGLRANASRRSHAELDQAADLDDGDPVAFGREHAALRRMLPHVKVLGGCCGTDHRHVEQIAFACELAAA
jgi:S-methylmethionine-dependent homocysteine/selenocysteine methylase